MPTVFTDNDNDPALTDPWPNSVYYGTIVLFILTASPVLLTAGSTPATTIAGTIIGSLLGSLALSWTAWKTKTLITS